MFYGFCIKTENIELCMYLYKKINATAVAYSGFLFGGRLCSLYF